MPVPLLLLGLLALELLLGLVAALADPQILRQLCCWLASWALLLQPNGAAASDDLQRARFLLVL